MDRERNLRDLAKQGHPKAIANLLNKILKPKGIQVCNASLKGNCLQLMFESPKFLDQEKVIQFVCSTLVKLEVEIIETVKIYSKRANNEFPEWHQEINLHLQNTVNLEQQAKRGDTKAINHVIQDSLKDIIKVSIKSQIKDKNLQLALKSNSSIDKKLITENISNKIIALSIDLVDKLEIYYFQPQEHFPDWIERIPLKQSEEAKTSTNEPQEDIETSEADFSLSYSIYDKLHCLYFRPISERITEENTQTSINGIVSVTNLDSIQEDIYNNLQDIQSALPQILESQLDLTFPGNIPIPNLRIQYIEADSLTESIEDLKKISEDLLNYDFPPELSLADNFWEKIAYNIRFEQQFDSDNFVGTNKAVGAMLGSMIAPGVGTVVGAAIGDWLDNSRRKKEIEDLFGKYKLAKSRVIEVYNKSFLSIYEEVCGVIRRAYHIQLQESDVILDKFRQYKQYFDISSKLYSQQKIEDCLEALNNAISFLPDLDHPCLIGLGSSQENSSLWLKVTLFMGNAYLAAKQLDLAKVYFKKILARNPREIEALYGLMCVSSLGNENIKALVYLELAIKAGFNDLTRLEFNEDIENLKNLEQYWELVFKILGEDA